MDPLAADGGRPPRRVRVDLAGRAVRRASYSRQELEEQTQVGEVLIRGLVRAQLALALSLAGVVVLLLGSLPIAFALFPALGDVYVLGLRLPWLLLGVLAYPLLYVVGRLHVRQAERIEDDFSKAVGPTQDPITDMSRT
ncbi:MAG: hypothetical protein H0U22_15645 [Geodermatophilaceae bacterium]|nr:hypothetical protein [Geodermatophilaceae bacterium]